MASETFNLAILLSLRDMASGGLGRAEAQLRGLGAAGDDALRTFGNLRQQMSSGLAIAGIGLAGLEIFKDGVKEAASFQEAMTELRSTMTKLDDNGSVNLSALTNDMSRAETIAIRLGNTLPGTTQDFIQMIQVLKQNGLDAETIMNGAADAVGNLAVANKEAPQLAAKNFAAYGNLFKLKGEDYYKVADIFSRINTSTGLTSSELVQSAKYFEGRIGQTLGLGGIGDAEKIARLIGLLGKSKIQGSMAGTSLNDFFNSYLKHGKAIENLQKSTGIKLDFFKQDGSLQDLDEIFRQLQQFKKLTAEDRAGRMSDIFGIRGMTVATTMLNTGTEGWQKFNEEQARTISLLDKNKAKALDFNNKLETLQGTFTNLKVTVFEPMLPGLTKAANGANTLVGSFQDSAKASSGITSTATSLAFLATTSLVVIGGFKALTAAWQLWQIASMLGGGGAAASLVNTGAAATGLRGRLTTLANSAPIKIGLTVGAVMGLEYAVALAVQTYTEALEAEKNKNAVIRQGVKNREETFAAVSDPKQLLRLNELAASTDFAALNVNNELLTKTGARQPTYAERAIHYKNWLYYVPGTKTQYDGGLGFYDKQKAVKTFQSDAPTLKFPAEMAAFLRYLPQKIGSDTPEKVRAQATIRDTAATAFPDSYKQALEMIPYQQKASEQFANEATALTQSTQEVKQSFADLKPSAVDTTSQLTNLIVPLEQANQGLTNLREPANALPQSFVRVGDAANNAANNLNGAANKISSFQMPTIQQPTFAPSGFVPSKSAPTANPIGGTTATASLANFVRTSRDEDSQAPSRPAERMKNISFREQSQGTALVYSPTININGGSPKAKEDFAKQLAKHSDQIERMLMRSLNIGRDRA